MSVPYGILCPESEVTMIVCSMCDDVLYANTMPNGLGELEKVVCAICAYDYTMEFANEIENNSFDVMADR